MANLKASIKALRQTKKRTVYNTRTKRKFRESVKAYTKLVESGDIKSASSELPRVYQVLDKAAKRGVIEKKASARQKSRLAKKLNIAAANVETAKTTA